MNKLFGFFFWLSFFLVFTNDYWGWAFLTLIPTALLLPYFDFEKFEKRLDK